MEKFDYVVVGSGLSGAAIARCLLDAGGDVLILERKKHIGGLCHDQIHQSGQIYHTYGPHAFRTTSKEVWDWVNKFDQFYPFKLKVRTLIDGELKVWPPSQKEMAKYSSKEQYVPEKSAYRNFEEAVLSRMPMEIYGKYVKSYTEKQWGQPASSLWVELADRFRIIDKEDDEYLFDYTYQGLPISGYTHLISKMIQGAVLKTCFDFDMNKHADLYRKALFYTGPIDEFYSNCFGSLPYRGMSHEIIHYRGISAVNEVAQPVPVINYPDKNIPYIRSIDWSFWQPPHHQAPTNEKLISYDFPKSAENRDEYAYPILTSQNKQLYERYKILGKKENTIFFSGRLAEYKYYDMDHAIINALNLSKRYLKNKYSGPELDFC